MSNEYIFFTDQTALTFRICLVLARFLYKVTLKVCGNFREENDFEID